MFVASMPLHILLCDEELPYFILCVEVFRNLNLNQMNLNLYKRKFKVKPTNPFNPIWVKG
jgi:hypothetical protein